MSELHQVELVEVHLKRGKNVVVRHFVPSNRGVTFCKLDASEAVPGGLLPRVCVQCDREAKKFLELKAWEAQRLAAWNAAATGVPLEGVQLVDVGDDAGPGRLV